MPETQIENQEKINNSLKTFQNPLQNIEKLPLAAKTAKREYKFARMIAGRVAKQLNWILGHVFETVFELLSAKSRNKCIGKKIRKAMSKR